MNQLAPYAKAIVAGISVAITAAIPLAADGLTQVDALTILGAFLAGAFPTWAVPNASRRNEDGVSDLGLAFAVLLGLFVAYIIWR